MRRERVRTPQRWAARLRSPREIEPTVPAWLSDLVVECLQLDRTARPCTAGVVMEKMDDKERNAYLAGVVEGLAYSRYARDGKKTEGMKCIYDWFYEKKDTHQKIYVAFRRFQDYLPGAVMAAMAEKECGS